MLGLAPANAAARSVLRPCGEGGRLSCGRISVALDPALTLRHDVGIPRLYRQQLACAGTVSGFTTPVPFGEIIHALSYIPGVTLSGRVEYVKSRGHFGSGDSQSER